MAYNSTFMGLNTALRGLLAHQAAMDVTGHNISNINTEGYSRQRAELVATGPLDMPAFNATMPGQIGTGVEVASFERMRDQYIDRSLRDQFGYSSSAEAAVSTLSQVEAAFNEPSDSGLAALFQRFFTSLEDVAAHPDDMSARQSFAAAADSLANGFNRLDAELGAIAADVQTRADNTVLEVDSITSRIAALNLEIRDAVNSGMQPNDLLDERDRLLDELSTKINFDYAVDPVTQMVDVTFPMPPPGPPAPVQLVAGGVATTIGTATIGGGGNLEIAYNAVPPTLTRGSLQADFDLMVRVIPAYRANLDDLAASFVAGINGAAAAIGNSYDLAGVQGVEIFDPAVGMDTAGNIRLNPLNDILADPTLIPAADNGPGEPGNGNNAIVMLNLRQAVQAALGGATWEDYYGSTVSLVGTDSIAFQRELQNRELLRDTLMGRRAEVSGVSLDEEMSNMLRFQHAYNASARVMTAVDEALDTLINRMGRVGL